MIGRRPLSSLKPIEQHVCFHTRLQATGDEVGGVRCVARRSGISEAQPDRSFRGTAILSDRIIGLARIRRVPIGWLFGEAE